MSEPGNSCGRSTLCRSRVRLATRPGATYSWKYAGDIGAWNQMTADEELGHVYIPLTSPTSAWYGGWRPGRQPVLELRSSHSMRRLVSVCGTTRPFTMICGTRRMLDRRC